MEMSRRSLFGQIFTGTQPPASMPAFPRSPAPGQPAATQGWAAFSGALDRLQESLPGASSGKADTDFALIAAPLLGTLVEMATERAAASSDKTMVALSKRISENYIKDLQGLIDWLQSNGHGVE